MPATANNVVFKMATPEINRKPVTTSAAKPATTPAAPAPTAAEIAAAEAKKAANLKERTDRFKKVAGARTVKLLRTMDNLATCSTKGNYEYTAEQVKTIFNTLREKLNEVENKFNTTVKAKKDYAVNL